MTTSAAKANRNADIVNRLEAENERLRVEAARANQIAREWNETVPALRAEIVRLRSALQAIADQCDDENAAVLIGIAERALEQSAESK